MFRLERKKKIEFLIKKKKINSYLIIYFLLNYLFL